MWKNVCTVTEHGREHRQRFNQPLQHEETD
jgi:hypothetical protein